MIWINLNVAVLDSPEFLGAEPTERATWLCLLRYCVGQENGGCIKDCRAWKDRQWQQLVRITLAEATAVCQLWTWEGDNVRVAYYPADKEAEVIAKRDTAKENGKRGGRPKKNSPGETQQKPTLVILEKPRDNPDETQVESGRGMERKEKGKENGMESLFVGAVAPTMEKRDLKKMAVEVYGVYPRKVGKPAALAKILKALSSPPAGHDAAQWPDTLLEVTRRYAAARQGEPEGFTPHPATWFHQQRYCDDPATWVASNGDARPAPSLPLDDAELEERRRYHHETPEELAEVNAELPALLARRLRP